MDVDLIWCHGGCFSGGSIEYDKELREYLSNNNICHPIPINFSLDNWDAAIRDIKEACRATNRSVMLGGISSGAMMADKVD